MNTRVTIVPYEAARHGDAPWQVIRTVFKEYDFEFTDGEYQDDIARYNGVSGWLAVAEDESGKVVGCVALADERNGLYELHRLDVLPEARRVGLGERLVRWGIDGVVARGGHTLELYSDVVFLDAHRLYRRMGFRNHRFRYAPDPWQSREWGFTMDVGAHRAEHDRMNTESR